MMFNLLIVDGGAWGSDVNGLKSLGATRRGNRTICVADGAAARGGVELLCPNDLDAPEQVLETEGQKEDSGNIRPKRHHGYPTAKAAHEHSLIHRPYRSWCKSCVDAQGKEDPHVSAHDNSEVTPWISCGLRRNLRI